MDALGDGVLVADAGWRVCYANAAWARMLGTGAADAVGQDLWAAFPGLAAEPGAAMIRATAADGETRRFDLDQDVAGERRSYGIRVTRDRAGALVLTLARAFRTHTSARDRALEDRNEENAALRALARQTAAVADMAELMSMLCVAANAQCGGQGATLVTIQDDVAELTSATGSLTSLVGRTFPLEGSLALDAVRARQVTMVEDLAATSRPLASLFGELAVGPTMVAPLIAHERVLGVLAVVRDRRAVPFATREAQRLSAVADYASLAVWKSQLLAQAQEADKAKGRFLATISHELRTPLTALAGYEELLVDAVLGPLSDAQREVLDRMHLVTQHLSALIEDVLSFTTLETGSDVIRPTDFLAADLLAAAAAVVQPLAEQKKIALVVESAVTPIRITTDVDKARQILVNLAGNAVKFTPAGEVRMSVSAQDNEVRLAVKDTGMGIARTDMQRLFRPFTQLDSGLTRRHGGTGLGLYLSQRFAALLGGRVEVESAPESGSTFTLVLPRE